MKTIYISIFLVLATAFSLQAQFLSDDLYSPYSDFFTSSSQDFIYASDFYLGMADSPFSVYGSQYSSFSQLLPSENWLTNQFGANYLPDYHDGWQILPYSDPYSGLKIPVGNGVMILTIAISLYTMILFTRKKFGVDGFA